MYVVFVHVHGHGLAACVCERESRDQDAILLEQEQSTEGVTYSGIGTLSKIKAAKVVVTGTASTVRVLLFMLRGLGLPRVTRASVAVRFLSGRLLPVAR